MNKRPAPAQQTLGERRVGVDFNPGGDPKIADIKIRAAHLIDRVGEVDDRGDGEIKRLKATAQTKIEDAAMWAVKAAARSAAAGGGG